MTNLILLTLWLGIAAQQYWAMRRSHMAAVTPGARFGEALLAIGWPLVLFMLLIESFMGVLKS